MSVHGDAGIGSERQLAARAQEIRAGLPGQLRQQRLGTASLLYGPVCSQDELRARIASSLPWKLGSIRRARLEPIEQTEIVIPDEILVKYDDAVQLGLFSRFMLGRPAYWLAVHDPRWLVAEIADTERWVAIARWQEG
jgi:hypothetical protein